MKICIYKDAIMIERATAARIDVTEKVLQIYGMRIKNGPVKDYFYSGVISFVLHGDELRVDLFEPHESGEGLHHIRITAYDW